MLATDFVTKVIVGGRNVKGVMDRKNLLTYSRATIVATQAMPKMVLHVRGFWIKLLTAFGRWWVVVLRLGPEIGLRSGQGNSISV